MGTIPLDHQNTARKRSHTLCHLCPSLVEMGSPKHRVTEGLANLVQVHYYGEDC